MRIWSLPLDAPISLTLAADARSAAFEPDNDQVWQFSLSENDPKGLAMQTTYGLRVRNMRILPAFELDGEMRHDPDTFHSAPLVSIWMPSYISLIWRAFAEFEVVAEYWVRSSRLLAGRFTITNLSDEPILPSLRLYGILDPGEDSLPMSASMENGVQILSGKADNLHPVVFLEGGARSEPAPYPALGVKTLLSPGSKHMWKWAHCGGESVQDGFEHCRETLDSNWDAEVARLYIEHSNLVEVNTGNTDWDAAFWAAQREAYLRYLKPHRKLKSAIPVSSRNKNDGSPSSGGVGAWEPANPWDAYYAALQLLPTSTALVQGYFEELMRLQEANGHIPVLTDFDPTREGWLQPPLLAQLAWRIFESTEDLEFLRSTYRPLIAFFNRWFDTEHDRDKDGFPEWDNVHQAGFRSWPTFSQWFPWSQGLELSTAETVDLASYLVLEGEALLKIVSAIGNVGERENIPQRLDYLKKRVEQSWQKNIGFQHADYYLDETVSGKSLGVRRGSFILEADKLFDPPVRVLLKVEGPEDEAHELRVRIHSRGRRGPSRVEQMNFRKFSWFLDFGFVTSEKPSAEIEKIEVNGLTRKFKTTVSLGDYARPDFTTLLPLTAGIPSKERAAYIVRYILMDSDRYWRKNGIPSVPADDQAYQPGTSEGPGTIRMLWNQLVCEGLLRYGYQEQAGELLTRLMAPILETLRVEHTFTAHYDPDGTRVFREMEAMAGLAPFSLLLKILGIQLITPRKVKIKPGNPFPEPIHLRWQGLHITCETDKTIVTFPDGGVIEVTGETMQLVQQID